MFSLIPVINFPGQQSIPSAVPFGQSIDFSESQNISTQNVTTSNELFIRPDDTPFFSAYKHLDKSHAEKSAKINEFPNEYRPYGLSYEPNQSIHQNKTSPPYPLYGWSFPSSYYQDPKVQKQKEKSEKTKIIIEDVEEFENQAIAEMEDIEIEDFEEKSFQVKFNIQGFTLKNIKIQRHEGQLLIEGKQKAKTSIGAFIRSFTYIVYLPENIETDKLIANLDQNGIFCIKTKSTNILNSNEKNQE